MSRVNTGTVRWYDFQPKSESFSDLVLEGLRNPYKELSAKLLYDQRGSELFEAITTLPEYYLTRTEIGILETYRDEMIALMGDNSVLLEYGSGNSVKVRFLLDRMKRIAAYMPIDISKTALKQSVHTLSFDYPSLNIIAVCADYTRPFELPEGHLTGNRIVFFSGSTIGNFEPIMAKSFMQQTRQIIGPNGGLLIGVDLKKDPAILHAAYNDRQEVTASFNLNVLRRINRELHANFNLSQFSHLAFYNQDRGRIEMHLKSMCDQTITVSGERIQFLKGETIHTENSYKYSIEEFQTLAKNAGLHASKVWMDSKQLYSMYYFEPDH